MCFRDKASRRNGLHMHFSCFWPSIKQDPISNTHDIVPGPSSGPLRHRHQTVECRTLKCVIAEMAFTLFSPMYLAFLHNKMCSSKAPGSDGLEVVQYDHSAPEVIKHDAWDISAVETDGRQSRDLPEVYIQSLEPTHAPSPSSCSDSGIDSVEEQHMKHEAPIRIPRHDPRRRQRQLIWVLIAIILVLITVGAVVGGVIGKQQANRGGVSNASKSDDSGADASVPSSTTTVPSTTSLATSLPTSRPSVGSMKATQNSGLALITANSGAERYAYQQNSNGTIVEIPYKRSDWSLNDTNIVTSGANGGSPLTAISVALGGKNYVG